jgi:bacteriocin-like protein
MSKTNDTSHIATFEHHKTLTDSELDAVTGGTAQSVTNTTAVARPQPVYPTLAK